MPSIFDTLQVVFWSLTYITIIVCGVKHPEEHKPMMPYIAGGLNLAWELNALLLYHHYGHIIWSGLDIMIFVLNLRNLKRHGKHRQYIYILYVIVAAATIYGMFKLPSGMLISSYTLDLIMAIEYVVCSKEISVHGKLPIAIFKWLGDLFAWLFYCKQSIFVGIIGAAVFLLNLFYLAYCMEERSQAAKRKGGR